jgi:dethiobiotin synthetase
MVRLSLPVLLVARPWLGTINHTLLSLRELRRAGLAVLGVVFNNSRSTRSIETLSLQGAEHGGDRNALLLHNEIVHDNRVTVERFSRVPVLGNLPFIEEIEAKSYQDFLVACSSHLPSAKDLLERIRDPWS